MGRIQWPLGGTGVRAHDFWFLHKSRWMIGLTRKPLVACEPAQREVMLPAMLLIRAAFSYVQKPVREL